MDINNDPRHQLAEGKARELAEQTFVAWIQLGLFLVSLGFASVGIISFMKTQQRGTFHITVAALVADFFVVTGFIAVIVALMQYRKKIKRIGSAKISRFDLPLFIGAMISLLGVFAFVLIVADWFF